MSESFALDEPDHFTAGAVGRPGQRAFYLQGREAGAVVTLKCEKEQVGALGEYLSGLLAKLAGAAPAASPSTALLDEQVEEEEEGGPPAAEPASARFAITRAQAAAFVERARTLVRAGRATCPMCGEPKDPAGHVCPRANGHVVAKE
ncbi:MAG: DUF3090 family protein [Candidatus Rokuibacteriota bacterium]|nr:MAG: DUF3090 family protein [Candidatus Rokubacteria bacterium]